MTKEKRRKEEGEEREKKYRKGIHEGEKEKLEEEPRTEEEK
jgi:hypothetical protein